MIKWKEIRSQWEWSSELEVLSFAEVKLYTPNTEMVHEEDRKSVIIQKIFMKKRPHAHLTPSLCAHYQARKFCLLPNMYILILSYFTKQME